MAFDAGSIEGSLTLDRSPFTEGLRLARAQAKRFEQNKITPVVDVEDAEAKAELELMRAELERLDHTRATPTVSVDTSHSRAQVGLLATAIIALGPAALVAGGVAAGALAPIAVGAAGLAVVALPALKDIHDAALKTGAEQQKALASLGPGAAPAIVAFKALNTEWHKFRADLNPAVLGLLTATFQLIGTSLPAFTPLIRLTAQSVTQLVRGLTPLAPVFAQAFMQMAPIIGLFNQGLLHMAQALAHWTQGASFLHFVQYVVTVGPQLVHTLGAVAGMFIQIGIAAAPMLPVILQLVSALAHIVGWLAKVPGLVPGITAAFITYKLVMLGATAATKLALLGLFGPAMQARLAAEASAAGAASGTAFGASFAARASLYGGAFLALFMGSTAAESALNPGSGPNQGGLQDKTSGGQFSLSEWIANKLGINQTVHKVDNILGPAIEKLGKTGFAGISPAAVSPTGQVIAGGGIDKVPKIHLPKIPVAKIPRVAPLAVAPVAVVAPHTRGGSSIPFARGGTQQEITGGGLAGPRSITNAFGLAPEITGQTVIFRHSPNYGQAHKADPQEKLSKSIDRLTDFLRKGKDRPVAHIEIKGGADKNKDVSTEIRRRGHTGGKR